MPDGTTATTRRVVIASGLLAGLAAPAARAAASKAELNRDGQAALQQLYSVAPKAREMGAKARAILVFPRIVKAGLMVGGLTGNGVLLEGGRPTQYFNLSAATYGLQIGAQKYAYALFFITQSGLDYLKKSDGWAIGSGPSVVVMDEGKAMSTTSTTLTQDVYAFPFGQKGLMAGLGLEGSKITQIHPSAEPADELKELAVAPRHGGREGRQQGEHGLCQKRRTATTCASVEAEPARSQRMLVGDGRRDRQQADQDEGSDLGVEEEVVAVVGPALGREDPPREPDRQDQARRDAVPEVDAVRRGPRSRGPRPAGRMTSSTASTPNRAKISRW